MVESKFYKVEKSPRGKGNHLNRFFSKLLITIIISLLLLIGFKWSKEFKQRFNQYVYNTSFPFSKVKEFYKENFGDDFVSKTLDSENLVFEEKLTYSKKSLYQDGVMLTVSSHYMTPALESGIIVFIGKKNQYGNTVIVQGMNGIDAWYGNIENVNVKLYDYVEKGSLIGETKDKTLYLAFQKDGKFVDYKDYIN